jgi:hypothetical protein
MVEPFGRRYETTDDPYRPRNHDVFDLIGTLASRNIEERHRLRSATERHSVRITRRSFKGKYFSRELERETL